MNCQKLFPIREMQYRTFSSKHEYLIRCLFCNRSHGTPRDLYLSKVASINSFYPDIPDYTYLNNDAIYQYKPQQQERPNKPGFYVANNNYFCCW